MKSAATLATSVALLSGAADAFWRMECRGRTGLARMDPLVEPGRVAHHAHAIHGGSNFKLETTYDDLIKSDCTSCAVRQDKSAYWTPSLHFVGDDGKAEVVDQPGGMLVYYLLPGEIEPKTFNVTSFPPGFRLLAGDARQRNFTGPVPDKEKSLWDAKDKEQRFLGQKAIGFNCLNYAREAEPTAYRHTMPDKDYIDKNCANGIRAEIFFPSCWDGKNLDSKNHKDHVVYPDLINAGPCPKSHPVQLPILLYETIWEANKFKGKKGKFVFANGDPTGCGYHADFLMGWEGNTLKDAVAKCHALSGRLTECPVFNQNGAKPGYGDKGGFIQSEDDMRKCHFPQVKTLSSEDCKGPVKGICGDVPILGGPAYAPAPAGAKDQKPAPPKSKEPAKPATNKPASPPAASKPAEKPKDKPADKPVPKPAETPAGAVIGYEQEPPAPTAAPIAAEGAEGEIIATKTITRDGVVVEVAVKEVPVYVTVEAPPAKRHVHHKHLRRDREHGLLGKH